MLQIILKQSLFIYLLTGGIVLGITSKLLLGRYYKKIAYAAENMGLSNRQPLKAIKTKFENSFKLNMGIHNVDAFVEKNISKQKYMGISIQTWDKLSYIITSICFLVTTVGAFTQYRQDKPMETVITTVFYGVFSCTLLLFFDVVVGTKQKREMLSINVSDYLENNLLQRMRVDIKPKVEVVKVEEEVPTRTMKDDMEYLKNALNEIASARNIDQKKITEKEEGVLEDILRDFFL